MSTQLLRGLNNILPQKQGFVATIGNFDGVHIGHKSLIEKVKMEAAKLKLPSLVITFEPQPGEFFNKNLNNPELARLTRFREKFIALEATGVDYVLVLRFNRALASLSAEQFVKEVLVKQLKIACLVVGEDFHFGHKRAGTVALLKQMGKECDFKVEIIPSISSEETRISSTWIRQALKTADLTLAKKLLGRPYTMMGRVTHGNKLGRKLGFPTANIYLHRAVTPLGGIYVVKVHGIEKEPLPGVANIGIRPTLGATRTLLEVHLFNFSENIYGRQVTVEFLKKLRDEQHFENLDLLKEAIAEDVRVAQRYFLKRESHE